MKKIIAVLAAAFMFGVSAFAEGYINANDLSVGEIKADAPQEDGFVIHGLASKSVKIEKNATKFAGEKFTQRIKMGGSRLEGETEPKLTISFPAKKGETISVYGKSSSKKDDRVAEIYDAEKNVVASLPMYADGTPKTAAQTFVAPADGTYSVGSKGSTIYIYKIEITK